MERERERERERESEREREGERGREGERQRYQFVFPPKGGRVDWRDK